MVSLEVLRRYPFFCCLDDQQIKALAMVTDEVSFEPETIIFREGEPARYLYLLIEGSVDLYFKGGPNGAEELLVGHVNPGEAFAISALIEPYTLTSGARAAEKSRALRLDGPATRALCELDCRMGYNLMRQAAAVALQRLNFTRVELAATRTAERSVEFEHAAAGPP